MDQKIADQLNQEELTPFHQKMLRHAKNLLSMSRQAMSHRYNTWDHHDDIYNGIRKMDEEDRKAAERNEPVRMIVPLTKSQVQTAVAFCLALYTQRPSVFELDGTGVEDWKAAKIGEATLQRDLDYNNSNLIWYQFLVDIFKFGIGIIKHSWVKETQRVPVTSTTPDTKLGPFTLFKGKTSTSVDEQTKFLGNRLYNISPYRFFPDPRLPLTRFQEGEFCGSEDEIPLTELRSKERDGYYAGTKFIKSFNKDNWETRGGPSGNRLPFAGYVEQTGTAGSTRGSESQGRAVCVSEMQIKIVPSEFEIEPGDPLGPEEYPVKYIVCLANDNRVIKCEPMGYIHDEFTYDVSQYDPDQHHFINGGLAESIDELQSVITWLINSHITAVRKTIQNLLVVDPDMVNMEDLKERRPVIRLRKGAAMSGIDRYIKQLEIRDVTQNNIRDAGQLGQIVQQITGVNENATGQYSTGRRSAEQTRAVNTGAATRLRIVALLIWSSGLLPLGRKMLSNLRDGLDEPTFVKVMGLQTIQPTDPLATNVNDFQNFHVTKDDLVGNYDFVMMDGTLPSDKQRIAGILQELLTAMIQNPQIAAVFGFNPKALLREILELQGVRNPERFNMQPSLPPGGLDQQQMQMQAAQTLLQNGQSQQPPTTGAAGASGGAQPPGQPAQQQPPATPQPPGGGPAASTGLAPGLQAQAPNLTPLNIQQLEAIISQLNPDVVNQLQHSA